MRRPGNSKSKPAALWPLNPRRRPAICVLTCHLWHRVPLWYLQRAMKLASFVALVAILAPATFITGCSSAMGSLDGTERLAPASVNDTTVPTDGFVAIGTDGTSKVDADGDEHTCWDMGTAGTRILAFASSPAPSNSVLNIVSSLVVADGSSHKGTVTVSYSVDGGHTFVSVWSASALQGRAISTDAITLPQGQRSDLVQVRFDATMPPLHFQGCEVWIEGSFAR
jgi:hypothetical protein